MDVGDDRDRRRLDDVVQCRGRFFVGAGDTDDVAAGSSRGLDLSHRRRDVMRQRICHGLHRDRRIAADRHVANHDLTGLTADDVAIGTHAHGTRASDN